jgi:hypothetical protein
MKNREERMNNIDLLLETLESLIDIQSANGTWDYNMYQCGLLNGLIVAYMAICPDELVTHKKKYTTLVDPPDEWIEDVINHQTFIEQLKENTTVYEAYKQYQLLKTLYEIKEE